MDTISDQQTVDVVRLDRALSGLRDSGVLTSEQCAAVEVAYRAAEPGPVEEQGSLIGAASLTPVAGGSHLKARLFEAAGYLGGVLVAASILALLGQYWDDLSTTGHVITLSSLALLAWVLGVVTTTTTPGGRAALLVPGQSPRRRIASVLLVVGSVLAAVAVGEGVADHSWTLIAVGATALILLLAAHRVAPSALTEVGMFIATVMTVMGVVEATLNAGTPEPFNGDGPPPARAYDYVMPIAVTVIGVLWASVIAPRLRLPLVATGIGLAAALMFTVPLASSETTKTGGLIVLATLTAIGLAAYQRLEIWPWLAMAALALTAFVVILVGQSAGAAAGLLSAGLILLAATAWGVRTEKKRASRSQAAPSEPIT
jgi:hypothetical protein